MPHMPAIDIALVMHLRDHGCQPFPFGSVVPRWLTAPAGSSLLWLDPAHRARVASKLVLAEYLRTRAVTIDVGRQMLLIDSIPKADLIPFAAIWDRWGFAHAVLRGAISTHTPPPLPDDALSG